MSTLALDLGQSTGWAVGGDRLGLVVEHGTQSFAPQGHEGYGRRFLRFRAWLHDVKARFGHRFTLVLYERVDFMKPGQVYAAHCWGGYEATLCAWCEHHDIPYEGIAVGTIKAAVCGSGRAKKPAIMAELRRRGYRFASHDEADAIALLLTAAKLEEAA